MQKAVLKLQASGFLPIVVYIGGKSRNTRLNKLSGLRGWIRIDITDKWIRKRGCKYQRNDPRAVYELKFYSSTNLLIYQRKYLLWNVSEKDGFRVTEIEVGPDGDLSTLKIHAGCEGIKGRRGRVAELGYYLKGCRNHVKKSVSTEMITVVYTDVFAALFDER